MSKIHLVHLYPKEMNIYGDTGNRLILEQRLKWHGIEVEVSLVGVGEAIPADADIILGGGGQDAGQQVVESDLLTKQATLQQMADDGVVMLMVCGLYQLFGHRFVTHEGLEIKGIDILPLETIASDTRMIGNTVFRTPFGEVVAYENHSGKTWLDDQAIAFGQMIKGDGNNGEDKTEGCVVNNIFGTYGHGPILSKNPAFADELIKRALARKGEAADLNSLNDDLEGLAHKIATSRPR